MNLPEALSRLIREAPDDAPCTLTVGQGSMTVGQLRYALAVDGSDRELTTAEAAEEFGHSPEWWSRRAEKVPGAWQENEGSPWYLPRKGCRLYLASLRRTRRQGRRGLRGPNKARHASPSRARTAGAPEGQVVGRGPSPLESREGGASSEANAA